MKDLYRSWPVRVFLSSCTWLALAMISLVGFVVTSAKAAEHDHAGHHDHEKPAPDDYAPIGVMGDHLHPRGDWMVSYRYMRMAMEGNRDGTRSVPIDEILRPGGTYGATPTSMDMDMHMVGVMIGVNDRVTLAAMLPFLNLSMDHTTAMGVDFTTRSSGIGDLALSALIGALSRDGHDLNVNLGFRFPTGSIDRKDMTPASMGQNVLLPYPMQLGSGTVDFLPGLTYTGRTGRFSWGGQAAGIVRIGTNDENYKLGNRYALTGWGAVRFFDWLSGGVRADWQQWFDIDGEDSRLSVPPAFPDAASFIPTADPDLRAGRRLDLGPSLNFVVTGGAFKGINFGVEALFPVYQSLNGPQLETDWTLMLGVRYPF